ncbi:MAG: hypothetical protein JXR64_08645 [Spirochaetales bacterium]|nr:hypothetical protein [Spirochaetales bacterium]
MKKIALFLTSVLLLTSCLTPKPDEKQIEVVEVIPEPEPVIEEVIVQEPAPEPEVYVATEEEYDRTFEEVELLIQKLNKIISSNDYDNWKSFLSESYIEKYGDQEYLLKQSDNPVLKDYGIKLKTLKDYFRYVVVPSRSNVVVDEIQFITETSIKAFTFKNNNKFLVYLLIKSDSGWIISD